MRTPDRWLSLFLLTRGSAVVVAVGLLAAHRVTGHDTALFVATVSYGGASMLIAARSEHIRDNPIAWFADAAAVLGLLYWTEDFRSPVYLLMLTALVLPCTRLPGRLAVAFSAGLTASYLTIAVVMGLEPRTLERTISLENVATHAMVPLLVGVALAYASSTFRRLEAERGRSERLAIEAERKRIAWDLHDSAKQRVHAAHLLLTAIEPQIPVAAKPMVEQALGELRSAAGDMATSVSELREPLESKPLTVALRRRAAELQPTTGARIAVRGRAPELAPLVASHAYRIAAEALGNAVRHAEASAIEVTVEARDHRLCLVVRDDGTGLPPGAPPASSNGLRSMRNRAEAIGARIEIGPPPVGAGTTVILTIPLEEGAPAT